MAIRCGNGSCDRCLCQHDLFGPMSTLIGLAMGDGQLSDETNKETAEVAEDIMEEGIVLLDNKGSASADRKNKFEFIWVGICKSGIWRSRFRRNQ